LKKQLAALIAGALLAAASTSQLSFAAEPKDPGPSAGGNGVASKKIDDSVRDALKSGQPASVLLTVLPDLPTNELVKVSRSDSLRVRAEADKKNKDVRTKTLAKRKSVVHEKVKGVQVVSDYTSLPSQLVEIDDIETAQKVAALPEVVSLSVVPTTETTVKESLPLINQPAFITNGDEGEGSTVAVLDKGGDYTKEDLGKCKAPGPDCRVVFSKDFAPEDRKLDAADGHGTNVAAIVARTAPKAKVAVLDIFKGTSTDGDGWAKAIQWVLDHQNTYNIVAANMSTGLRGVRTTSECSGTASFVTEFGQLLTAGVVPVVSAGNSAYDSGKYKSGVTWPACLPGAVTVGATYDDSFLYAAFGEKNKIDDRCSQWNTSPDQITCFSQGGSLIDLVAPGSAITAGGNTKSGTSQAAPHVAGAVALLAAKYPEANVTQIADSLRDSSTQVADDREKALGNDISYPRLDVTRASGRLAERLRDKSISDGTVQLGVNEYGALIAPDPDGGTVGLRYIPTNADAVAPGCYCEGWGIADVDNWRSAYTNQASGTRGVTPDSYNVFAEGDGVLVATQTDISLKVLHAYTKTSVPGIYRVDVEIHNTGTSATGNLVYRRVVDWDVPPTTFNEYVSSTGSSAPGVRFVSDDGFASSDPLTGPTTLVATGDFADSGPTDHGTLLDINVGTLDAGAFRLVTFYYGAGPDETRVKAAMVSLGAGTYSIGKPSTEPSPASGSPNTFVLGYKAS
jgi:Subtilase family